MPQLGVKSPDNPAISSYPDLGLTGKLAVRWEGFEQYMDVLQHNLKSLLPLLLLSRRPPSKPSRYTLTRRPHTHPNTLATSRYRSSPLTPLRRLAGTNDQLRHLTTSRHLLLTRRILLPLSFQHPLSFTSESCALLLRELGVCFLGFNFAVDAAGGGDPVVRFWIGAGLPVREDLG